MPMNKPSKRQMTMKNPIITLGVSFLILMESVGYAADLGVRGETWEIGEIDIIEAIHSELEKAEDDGRLAVFNDNVKKQATDAFYNQKSLGLKKAVSYRTWEFDPTITLQRDIKTHQGKVVAERGTKVNPLDYVPLARPLLFLDGTDEKQLDWGLSQEGMMILTAGAPLTLEKEHDRQMWFDQKGIMVKHFSIKAMPARVTQNGKVLKVEEVPPAKEGFK